jgi:integrase
LIVGRALNEEENKTSVNGTDKGTPPFGIEPNPARVSPSSLEESSEATKRPRWVGPVPKYKRLLDDPETKRWYDNVCRGSKITADVYLRRLGYLCQSRGFGPQKLVQLATANGERWAYGFLMDVVTELEGERKAGSYIESNLKAVKSWLVHNGVEIKGRIKIRGARDTPTLRDKRALTGSELAVFLSNAPPQTRCAAVLIGEAGLRIESVGNYEGTDGLRIGDLPDLRIAPSGEEAEVNVTFARVPTMVVVRAELSKAGHQYFSFLTAEACRHIAGYLEQRIKSGEVLDRSSPLVTPNEWRRGRKNDFVRSVLVGDLIRKRLRRCGISTSRPYDLRATFATQMMLAESKGLIIRDYRVFFMGHKGDIEHTYTTNRHTLPSKVVEDMRAGYSRAQKYLESENAVSEGQDLRVETRRQLLLASGFTEEEIEKMGDIASVSNQELHEAIKRKLLGVMTNNGAKQKVVSLSEVEKYISGGWEFVATLPNGKAILKLPF